jgi:dienelactone hydrolase
VGQILAMQDEQRVLLYELLGDLPSRDRAIGHTKLGEENRGKYVLERLILDLNGNELVPAYFTRPLGVTGRFPVILFNHSHGGNYDLGKDELILGNRYLQDPPYAEVLAEQGWGALAIDAWNFGERHHCTESELFKEMLWQGKVLWGHMVFDSLMAIRYLLSRSDVDGGRIGTLGMSMGSTMAWWVAALDPRIKVCVDICCLTDFQALIKTRGLDGHGIYYYVPGLIKHFTTASINALIAPRPHLGLAGNLDPLTPPEGLDRIDNELKQVYNAMGAGDAWQLFRSDTGHVETDLMRQAVLEFLQEWF